MTGPRYDRAQPARDLRTAAGDTADIRILLMTGSARAPSHTSALGDAIRAGLERAGAATSWWDAHHWPLPPADPAYHRDPTQNPDPAVRALVAAAAEADGFVLGSPVYHNSYSAVLKNALDHLGIAQFHYKPVVVVSHGSRATHAVDHLRVVARGLLAVGLPTQICTDDSDYDQTQDGGYALVATDVLTRVERLCAELVAFAHAAAALRAGARR